jgi:hypothetical protein
MSHSTWVVTLLIACLAVGSLKWLVETIV